MVYAADPIAGFGTALDFDGTDDYVQLTNRAIDNSQLANFSLEMWFKTSQTNKGALYEQHMWIRMDPSNDRIRSFLGDNNSNNIAITPAAYNDGQWHHIAVVASGGNLQKIYIDGSKVVEQAGAYNTSPTADVVGIIGRMGQPGGSSYDYFDGKIAEVRIWSTARSQDDIKSTMNLSLKGDETGLVGYWPLNESSGTTATDNKSGGSNNGTLNGPTWTSATISVEFTILEDSGAFNGKLPASDADGESLTYSAGTTTPTKGSVTINNDGTFTYTPNADENGTDSFSYKVNDGNADSTEVTVTVNITPANDPEIDVQGNSISISDGDNSPSTSDDTDFGSVTVGSNITKTFTIKNTGNAALNLTDSPIVAITGSGFSITTQPTSPVAATTGETTFVVQFAPSSAGEVTASISIANDDSDENPYDFAIKATATNPNTYITNGQDANGVLGQPDLTSNGFIRVSGDLFRKPRSIAVDPTTGKVFISDKSNRVLRFSTTDAFTNGATAEAVLGQPDFTSDNSATTQSAMNNPKGLFVDQNGRLWVADTNNSRVLRFDNAATKTNGANADGVLGKTDFTSNTTGITQSNMTFPTSITVDNNDTLWVADTMHNRVLRFDNAATKANGANADAVLGQADFTTDIQNTTQNSMSRPSGVTIDNGTLWVADASNNRVLRFDNAATKANGANADGVLGQMNFTTNYHTSSAAYMYNPTGVTLDAAGRLYVLDSNNNRVTIFQNAASKSNGADADFVLGQADFYKDYPNLGGVAANTMNIGYDSSIIFDNSKGSLWVADGNNHRVLRFDLVTPELAPPEMNLKANNITIVDGDTTASISDHTDFGSADITIGTVTRTFTIENTGDTVLSISNTSISGSNASDFSVTVVPETSVTASESITFTITFDPSAVGISTATMSIANDDSDENPYDFAIQGTGTAAPEIDVEGKSQSITDFGSVTVGTNITKTFTIKNAGNAELTLTGSPIVSVTGSGFSITTQPTSPVAANGETTFVVQFTPSSAGEVTGSISIANDDSDENPYDFAIKAIGTNPNQAPTISGTPKTQIDAGSDYEFTPTASDPDGDSLTFEIQNKPEWANFDSTTGKLSGQPSSSQTGISANIKISVTDGNTTIFLPAFNILVNAVGGNIKPSAIVATAIVGGANPAKQKVRAYYPFGYNRNYMMSYLQVNANFAYHRYNFLFRDSKWAEWEVLFNTKRLGVGVHRGTITIQTGNGNETIPIVVNMLDAAELELSRSKLSFGVVQGGKEPTKQKIRVSSSSKTLNWSTTINANWLTVPSQGTTTEDIEIGINTNQLPNAGEHTAIISFRDNESGKTIDVPVTLNVIAANSEEVKLTALEVVQVIQDLNNSIPLIAEKPTFVRAHVSSTTESNVDNVNAKLTGKNGDTVVFEISPSNTGGSINVLTKPNRSNLNDSFLFELPKEFSKGNLSLEFSGVDKPFACEDCTATVSFETIPEIDMELVDIVWQKKSITPTQEMRQAYSENIYNIYPISTLNVTQNNIPLILNSANSSELLRAALRSLNSMKYNSGSAAKTKYYYGVAGKFYGTVGISYRPGTLATGAYLEGIDLKMFGNNLKLGKSNSPCGKTVSGSIFSKTISPVTTGADAVYGFNAKTKRIYPPTTSDFMTKRTGSWISDYNYKCAIETLKASTRSARSSRSIRSSLVNIVTINGRITGTSTGVIDNLVNSIATSSVDAPTAGDYKMSLQTRDGSTELAAYPFGPVNMNVGGDSDASESNESAYSLILPRPDNMKRIVLFDKTGNKLDERIASANAPTVSITAPNGGETIQNDADKLTVTWEANDADGDTLSYAIEYSLDGGTNWQTLVSGYDQKSIEIDVALLAGTKQGKFRVTADDSFNSGSDESNAVFTVEGKDPEVSITSPSNGDLFISGQSINFVGQANDKEDGKLTAASLTWSSDRDGDLGTGESLSKLAEDLAEGTHTITLTATDSQNQTGTSTISINVYRERPTSLPATFSVSEDNFTIGGNVNGGTVTANLTISNGGDGSLTWSAASDANWLTFSETTGTAPSNIKLIANPAGLAVGVYSGKVILNSDVDGVMAKTIEVTFRIQEVTIPVSVPVQQGNTSGSSTISDDCNTEICIIKKDEIRTGEILNHRIISNNGMLKDITFDGEELKGGTLAGKLTNKGTFVDVKLSENTEIQGGHLRGKIVGAANVKLDNLEIVDNSQVSNVSLGQNVTFGAGVTLKDVKFMGASISNATLEGTIRTASSATVIKDVVLGTKTQVIGGKLAGTIKGDNTDRALLQHLKIEPNSKLSEVIIADGVDIEAGVTLGT
jgi:VCBS repeat-containing protein